MTGETEPLSILTAFVLKYPTQSLAAQALGIRPTYLSDLLLGRRAFSPRMLAKLGLKTIIIQEIPHAD
jgi:plasmid maintenance system antidote protein VapI